LVSPADEFAIPCTENDPSTIYISQYHFQLLAHFEIVERTECALPAVVSATVKLPFERMILAHLSEGFQVAYVTETDPYDARTCCIADILSKVNSRY